MSLNKRAPLLYVVGSGIRTERLRGLGDETLNFLLLTVEEGRPVLKLQVPRAEFPLETKGAICLRDSCFERKNKRLSEERYTISLTLDTKLNAALGILECFCLVFRSQMKLPSILQSDRWTGLPSTSWTF